MWAKCLLKTFLLYSDSIFEESIMIYIKKNKIWTAMKYRNHKNPDWNNFSFVT